MILTEKYPSTGRRTSSSATVSITNLPWTDMGPKPGLRNDRPAINSLSHGTSISGHTKPDVTKNTLLPHKDQTTDFWLTLYSDKNEGSNQPTNQIHPQPAPRCTVLLEKLTVPQLVKKFPALQHDQPTTCLYPKPHQSSPCPIPIL
jgi:hypothetical protein